MNRSPTPASCRRGGVHPRPGSPLCPGFTLIEIILVLVVLAVAGVLAVPAIQPVLDSVRAEAGARRTAAFLEDVRRRAVLERRTLLVTCRAEEGRLELEGATGEPRPFPIPGDLVIASCEPEQVRYFPQGSATGMTLVLRDARGRERRVSVGAFTGLARIETPSP